MVALSTIYQIMDNRIGVPSPDEMVVFSSNFRILIGRDIDCEQQRQPRDLSSCVPRTLFPDSGDYRVFSPCVAASPFVADSASSCPSPPPPFSFDRVCTPYNIKMRRNKRIKRRLKKIRAIERKRRLEEEDGGGGGGS